MNRAQLNYLEDYKEQINSQTNRSCCFIQLCVVAFLCVIFLAIMIKKFQYRITFIIISAFFFILAIILGFIFNKNQKKLKKKAEILLNQEIANEFNNQSPNIQYHNQQQKTETHSDNANNSDNANSKFYSSIPQRNCSQQFYICHKCGYSPQQEQDVKQYQDKKFDPLVYNTQPYNSKFRAGK